jgi:hypothetical protein
VVVIVVVGGAGALEKTMASTMSIMAMAPAAMSLDLGMPDILEFLAEVLAEAALLLEQAAAVLNKEKVPLDLALAVLAVRSASKDHP